ncbi:MAG TPA: oxidoreductase [Capsulimonadaceae bacterium]|jgi:NAD(P)-dependent dehydrogenase (short-subunit alcohol dehydrogenase family)
MKKTALVTGASSGIGETTAVALNDAGYVVYAGARRVERMDHLREAGIRPVALDVTDEASIQRAIGRIREESEPVSVLVNNAGYGSYGAVEDVPLDEARRQLDVNLFGLARVTQLILPDMRKQHSGTIINISSIGGRFGEPLGAWYHASKYAVEGFSDSLALEVAPFGIKVVVVQPGAIKTEWGGIANDSVAKVSGDGPYADLVRKRLAKMESMAGSNFGDEPAVVAAGIVKILAKRNPAMRYPIGGGAPLFMFLRSVLSDRLFYKLLLKIVN